MDCDPDNLDRDHAIEAFNRLLDRGNYQYDFIEYEEEEIQDDDEITFNESDNILTLEEGLRFFLEMRGPETNFCVKKSLGEIEEFRFDHNTTTMFVRGYPLTNLQMEIGEGLITFNVKQGLIRQIRDQEVFRQLRRIANSQDPEIGARYEAEYEHKDHIPVRLQDYTNDFCILQYFRENNLLISGLPQQNVMFLDLDLPMI